MSGFPVFARLLSPRAWRAPLIALLPMMAVAAAEGEPPTRLPALATMGQQLFFDQRLSADGKTACSSCHHPEKAFQDGRPVSLGAFGRTGMRNTPSLFNVGRQTSMFWDGRRSTLEEQAADPLLNELEHGLGSEEELATRLGGLTGYEGAFRRGAEVATLRRALAAFQHTLTDGDNSFERFLFKGDREAIPLAAQRGWALFSGRARCIECHKVGESSPALFTDHKFHGVVAQRPGGAKPLADLVQVYLKLSAQGMEYGQAVASEPAIADLGRFVVTREPSDIGRFKTPSLRNVEITAPYMHDGSVSTLGEAVDLELYYRSRSSGRPLILLESEKRDLLVFLQTLTADRLRPN